MPLMLCSSEGALHKQLHKSFRSDNYKITVMFHSSKKLILACTTNLNVVFLTHVGKSKIYNICSTENIRNDSGFSAAQTLRGPRI